MTIAISTAFQKTSKGIRLLTEKPALDDYIATFEGLHVAHDAVQWCLGDMVLLGRDFWPDEHWQVADQYAPGYLDNLARTCALFDMEARHHFEVVTFSIFRAVTCSWLENEDRLWALDNAARFGWTVARMQDWKRDYWREVYPELPYTATNARDPLAALARMADEDQKPVKKKKPLVRLRYYTNMLADLVEHAQGETVRRLDVSLIVSHFLDILEELNA